MVSMLSSMISERSNALLCVVGCSLLVGVINGQGLVASQSSMRVANCKLGATSLNQCDTMGYVTRVAVFSAPGLIVAGLILLAMPLYLIGKYLCDCCGGRKQKPNFCCPADDLEAIYSKGDLIRPRMIVFLALTVAVGAFIWGYVGGGSLQSGLVSFGDQISNIPVVLRAQIDAMDAALTVSVYDNNTNKFTTQRLLQTNGTSIMSAANSTLTQMSTLVDSYVGKGQAYVKQYTFIVFVFFAIPIAVLGLGALFALFNVRKFGPMTLVWLCFLLGTLVWGCHAVFCMASMIVADGCQEVHGVAYQQENVLSVLVGCNDSMFTPFLSNFEQLRTNSTQALCAAIQPYCYDVNYGDESQNLAAEKVLVCPQPMDCTKVTFGQMMVWMSTAFFTNRSVANDNAATGYVCSTPANKYNCFLDVCASDCTSGGSLSRFGKMAKKFSNMYDIAVKISNTIDTMASQYSNCASVFTLLISPLDPPCKTITTALIADRQASGLLGLALIAGIFALAWGAKRFLPLKMENIPQRDEEDAIAMHTVEDS